ncbi:MAG: hypothetical protein IJX86_11880 [Lachnospiraceae bacterium]|nr:hypothetical protein [Lachnospiraceae bacterium]
MRSINYDNLVFLEAVGSLQTTTDNMDVTSISWETMGEQSAVFDAYLEGYKQLRLIMELYQDLLYKDISALGAVGFEMLKKDFELTNLWK